MAIKQETIDSPADKHRLAAGRRAVLVIVALLVGGASLGLRALRKNTADLQSAAATKKDESPLALAPDHEGAAALEAPADSAVSEGGDASPERANAQDDLLVTDSVPSLSAGPELSAKSNFERQQEEQLYEHLLKVQREQFEMRERALRAPSRVQEYAEAVQAQNAQSAQLLAGLATNDSPDGELTGVREAAEPLRALAAMRGLVGSTRRPAGSALAAALSDEGPEDTNPNQEKRTFFQHGGAQLEPGRLEHALQHPKAPYELRMGTVIPGVLVTGMNSEAPGQIVGQVTEDVLDSIEHEQVLIPQGSQIVGTYSASISQGQSRIQVAWVRLNLPNGTYLDLGGMSGADQEGVAGFHDKVNRHFARRLAAALMSSAFTVGLKLTDPPGTNRYGDAIHRGVGENVVQLGVDMAREEGRIPPTLEIRPGYRLRIMVSKDIGFPSPYPGRRHRGRVSDR